MIYPELLKENDLIGITALSKGVGHKVENFDEAIHHIHSQGYQTLETKNVRSLEEPSSDAKTRAEQFNELLTNKDVKAIWCASGGDFQVETVPLLDFEQIKKHPKWMLGASDPTNLLFPVTCACDIATIYGFNAGSFDHYGINEYTQSIFHFLKGNNQPISSSIKHQHVDFFNEGEPILNEETNYIGQCDVSGRMLGGCFESINDLAGTPYDYVSQFNERYQNDGIIWFFDIFCMDSCDVYRSLLKMKSMNYFQYTKAILVGRVLFENNNELISYQEAFTKVLPNLPIVFETDIGHTYPHFHVINGSIGHVQVNNGKGTISYQLI